MRTMDLLLVTIVGNRVTVAPTPTMTLNVNDQVTFTAQLQIFSDGMDGGVVDHFHAADTGTLYLSITNLDDSPRVVVLPQTVVGLELQSQWISGDTGNFIAYPEIPADETLQFYVPYRVVGAVDDIIVFDFNTDPTSLSNSIDIPLSAIVTFDQSLITTFDEDYVVQNDVNAIVQLLSFTDASLITFTDENLRSF